MVGTLDEIIKNMESCVYDFTENGKCIGCGKCCSNFLPISRGEIGRIKKYVKRHAIKESEHKAYFLSKQPNIDLTCPFLDESKKDKKCKIYEVRPDICRVFQCNIPPSKIEKNKIDFHMKREAVDMRAVFFGGEYAFAKIMKGMIG